MLYIQFVYSIMQFEWDNKKNKINIEKHRIRFQEAVTIFDSIRLTAEDDRTDYGET